MSITIDIFKDTETEEYCVSIPNEEYDDYYTMDRVIAEDEATSWAEELVSRGKYVYIKRDY